MLRRHRQSNQPAPIMTHQGDLSQGELLDKRFDGLVVQPETVVLYFSEFVRAGKPDEIRRNHALPRTHKERNHLAIEKGPGRFAVQTQDRLTGSFVHVVDPHPVDLYELRRVWKVR